MVYVDDFILGVFDKNIVDVIYIGFCKVLF